MKIYVAFVDPSGGSSDSMTLAIAHRNFLGKAVCDAVFERKAPFNPDAVTEEFSTILKSYGIASVTGDAYGGEWPRQRFHVYGIAYRVSQKTKSQLLLETLALINSGRAKLPAEKKLRAQFLALERHVSRSGKDAVDHPPSGHDDVANSCAGALCLAANGIAACEPHVWGIRMNGSAGSFVSSDPGHLWNPYNDWGFTNPGPYQRVASFAKVRPAPPVTPISQSESQTMVHSHYSPMATKAEFDEQSAMDPTETGWAGKHSHFAPGSQEKE